MATVTSPPPSVTSDVPQHHQFTVEQYHRMIDAGILKTGDRLELLDGWIVDKMTNNPLHANRVARLIRIFAPLSSDELVIRIQLPITLATSEPEPDLVVAKPPLEQYDERHPGPADILLLIEVADSSLAVDRNLKRAIYARARLPIYWIVNIPERRVEVYTQPRAGRNPTYRRSEMFGREANVPVVIDGREIAQVAVGELLPA
jgi:hypothetical protein